MEGRTSHSQSGRSPHAAPPLFGVVIPQQAWRQLSCRIRCCRHSFLVRFLVFCALPTSVCGYLVACECLHRTLLKLRGNSPVSGSDRLQLRANLCFIACRHMQGHPMCQDDISTTHEQVFASSGRGTNPS